MYTGTAFLWRFRAETEHGVQMNAMTIRYTPMRDGFGVVEGAAMIDVLGAKVVKGWLSSSVLALAQLYILDQRRRAFGRCVIAFAARFGFPLVTASCEGPA